MRWIWIDTFVEFLPGQRAVAIKNVTLAEEYLHDHFPGFPVVPPSLMIEGMAQTAGILVGEARDFQENVILAKVRIAEFDGYAVPGDQILYEATIDSIEDRAAVTSGVVKRNNESIGRVDLIFSHVNNAEQTLGLPDHNFVFTDQFAQLLSSCRKQVSRGEFNLMGTKRRVVVTGLGVGTPIGIGIEPFWDALMTGSCGFKRIEAFDPSGFPSQIGGELPPFKLGDYIPKTYRKSAKVMSRDIQIAVASAYHAVRDAGLSTKCIVDRGEADGSPNIDSTRFGANIGAGLICADLSELAGALATAKRDDGEFDINKWGSEGMQNLTPLWLLKFLPNMLACHVTIVHDCQAPSNTMTCGEASSHLAIGEAFRTIARGAADVCICGGAESKMNPMALARPQLLNRLNADSNDHPERAVRPFASECHGTVAAEGGGLVILESLDHAKARGARIYAEMGGFGAASNAHHWADPDPEGKPISVALKKAVTDAGLTAQDIDLAVPFGVGIDNFDASEMNGWNGCFGDRLREIPAVTTRPATGYNGAGCGALDFAAMVLSLYRSTVPPTPNTGTLSDICRFRFASGDPKDARIRNAVTSGYALAGGQAAALVIKRFEE